MNFDDKLKSKKVLVTGGAGFIGSNLCESLLEAGAHVVCLDNLSTGKVDNIQDFLNDNKFVFIEGDICDLQTCEKSTSNVDYVLHHAALGSVSRSIVDPIQTNQANVNGFLNMLTASRNNKIHRFIFASSSSVYGDSKILPKVETKIGDTISPYASTKLMNELYANNFSQHYNLDFIGFRYFNVFGKKQDPNGDYAAVIPSFIKKILKLETPTINGDGFSSRDFTFIKNIVYANFLALTSKKPESLNQIYNIACGQKINLNDLFSTIKNFLIQNDSRYSNIYPIHGPFREGDIPHSQADITKAKELLGYSSKFCFDEGIKETIKWYQLQNKT